MITKPTDVFDREMEWEDLADFADSPLPGLRIAIVYGRRRQGKSYLLRRLAEASGGLYHLVTEQTETFALRRFADSLGHWLDMPAGALSFPNWEKALFDTADLVTRREGMSRPPLMVMDEFPYLTHETQGMASIVQALYDEINLGTRRDQIQLRLVLCGSAISVMSDLLSGTKALRGRGALEMRIKPFRYRDARTFWGIENVRSAFLHNALIGGTPGYRDLVPNSVVPTDPGAIGPWIARNVLRPTVPLFDEANRIIHEDPRIRDTASYSSLMAAIAAGESSPAKIGGLLGRPANSLSHQLGMLESSGFVVRSQDMLLDRRPVITVADPLLRLHHLVIEPHLAALEAEHATQVWSEAAHTVDSKILGPHFEALATEWVTRYAREEAGLIVGATGHATVPCREHKTSHEIDIFSLERGARPRTAGTSVAFIGEAKARSDQPGLTQLERLEHIRELLTATGHDASKAVLGIFSTTGFTDDLVREANRRENEILLADLDRIYGV